MRINHDRRFTRPTNDSASLEASGEKARPHGSKAPRLQGSKATEFANRGSRGSPSGMLTRHRPFRYYTETGFFHSPTREAVKPRFGIPTPGSAGAFPGVGGVTAPLGC